MLLVFPNWTSQSEETSVALNILKKQAIIKPRTCVRMVRLAAVFSALAQSLIGCQAEAEPTPAPFKLAHLPKDSDGILQPAPVHFRGQVAIINGGVWGGSHLDQFVAMFVDNDLAVFVGMPTGGYSNTWEGYEVLEFPDTGRPVVQFMWSIGHTIRPNGEVLEGNPAQPDTYIPLTRDNFREYHQTLLDTAMAALDQ